MREDSLFYRELFQVPKFDQTVNDIVIEFVCRLDGGPTVLPLPGRYDRI